jgi:hypothetical protein
VASGSYRMAPPRYTGGRIATMPPGFRGPGVGGYGAGSAYSGYRHGYGGEHEGHRRAGFYRGPVWSGWFGAGYVGYPGYPFDYGLSDYGFDTPGYDAGTVAPDYGAAGGAGYAAGPPPDSAAGAPYGYAGDGGQGYRPPYQPNAAPSAPSALPMSPAPSSTPAVEEAVTLVFKDGRPAEEIHNYAMTRTTLYVQDQHHREIPLDEIDLAATERVNRKAGMSFEVPSGAR